MFSWFDQQITFLYTTKYSETIEFYETTLGLELVLDQKACRIYRVNNQAYLAFCESCGSQVDTDNLIITLVTEDVDGWYEKLVAKGVVFEKTPQLNERFNIYQCFLRDPNGYLLEIQRFEDPGWYDHLSV